MGVPTASWVFEIVGAVAWVALLVVLVTQTVRTRRLSFWGCLFIGGTSMFWLEWYGDWATYLLYNPRFHLLGWHRSLWTTPNKPTAVIAAYGWYYCFIFPAILGIVALLRRRRPEWGRPMTLLLVTIPLFYAWDLLVEGMASVLGWWSYTSDLGPAINSSKGSFPLLYPILFFTFFGVVATWVMDQRDDRGGFRLETVAGVARLGAGWRREVGRAATWSVALNVLYLVTLIGPIVALRAWFGSSSHLVP